MKIRYFKLLFIPLFLLSCGSDIQKNEKKATLLLAKKNSYAQLFSIVQDNKLTKLSVHDDKKVVVGSYLLFPRQEKRPEKLKNELVISTPIKKIICLSTTHIGFLGQLKMEQSIVGVSGKKYFYNAKVRAKINNNTIEDVGVEQTVDIEKIIGLKPDVVTIYNISGEMQNVINQLRQHKIPVLLINEYRESSPLGQAEWLKVFGLLFNKEELAEKMFSAVVRQYQNTKKEAAKPTEKPSVLVNMPWKGTWYMAGGQSNISTIIADAGGNFLWKESNEKLAKPLDFEAVFVKANKAKIWLNPGAANSLADIKANDIRLANFSAFTKGNVFARNKRSVNLANDFLETGIARPDIVLKDLTKILHPELFPNYELYFYQQLH